MFDNLKLSITQFYKVAAIWFKEETVRQYSGLVAPVCKVFTERMISFIDQYTILFIWAIRPGLTPRPWPTPSPGSGRRGTSSDLDARFRSPAPGHLAAHGVWPGHVLAGE